MLCKRKVWKKTRGGKGSIGEDIGGRGIMDEEQCVEVVVEVLEARDLFVRII